MYKVYALDNKNNQYNMSSVPDEIRSCANLLDEREKYYGDPIENFERIAKICELFGVKLKPSEICKVMIAVKWSRESNKHKQDNIKDSINYHAIFNVLIEHEENGTKHYDKKYMLWYENKQYFFDTVEEFLEMFGNTKDVENYIKGDSKKVSKKLGKKI